MLEDDALELPEINNEVDIYDVDTKEVLILADGIGVKKQSESRVSLKKASLDTESNPENDTKSAGSRVNSNVVLTSKKNGGF